MKIWRPDLSNISDDAIIADNCVIHSHCWIGRDVIIGSNVKIQAFTFIPDGVRIEDNVFIGPRVTFTNDPDLECKGKDFWKMTRVKEGAKIGACVSIKAGVIIGKNAIVGMGAVVLTDIPDGEKWAGVPARKIG